MMTGDRAGAGAPAVALQAPAAEALRVLLVEDGEPADLAERLAAAALTPRRVVLAEALAPGSSPLEEPCDLVIACLPAAHGAEALLMRLRRLLPAPAVLLLADGVDAQRELALLRAGCTQVLGAARSTRSRAIRRPRRAGASCSRPATPTAGSGRADARRRAIPRPAMVVL